MVNFEDKLTLFFSSEKQDEGLSFGDNLRKADNFRDGLYSIA